MNSDVIDGIGADAVEGQTLLTPSQEKVDAMNAKRADSDEKDKDDSDKKDEEKEEQEKKKEEEKKEAAKSEHDDKYFVAHKAECACDKAENPKQTAKLLVTSHNKVVLNDQDGKFFATEADKTFDPPASTFGKCKLQPSSNGYLPCTLAPAPKWSKVYEKTQVLGNKVLTEISTLQCTIGGKIEIVKHGQTDSVMKEHADNTNAAALALINPAVKMPVLETAYPSVSAITLKSLENEANFKSVSSSEGKKVEQVLVRPNTECTFEAKIKKGNVALTSWVIYEGHTGDKEKKILTSEQIGTSFKNSFPALGKYRVEGYGKPKREDFEKGIYDKNYTDCSIDIEVVENKLIGKELIPIDGENFVKLAGGKMRLRQNFPANFKANFLMLPTDEELEHLRLYVTDASGNVIKSVKVDYTVSFTPINTKALYKVIAEYKLASGELLTQSFTAETMTNSVSSIITHDAEVIRPGTPMSFSVKEGDFSFYVPNDEAADAAINKEFEQVKWNLNGRLLGTGKSITVPGHEFVRKDKYVVEAYVMKANAYGQNSKDESDDWRFEVKDNDVISFSYIGVPKVGKTTQLIADSFLMSNLLQTELVTWQTTIPHKNVDKKTISITPVIAGKQNVKCAINSEPGITLSIDVKQAKVLGMFFTDSNGIEIEKSSWLQTVNIWVKQENLIGEDLTIEIWDNDAFKNDYCKVINVPKYDGNLIPFTLDSYVRGKAGDWGMLYVKIGAPNLKLANTNNVFESKNHLDVEDKREIYTAHIGSQDGVKRHTHVDYNQISYFYAKSRGIKKEEQLSLAIYDKDKIILEAKNVHADESGMIKIKLEWNKVSLKLPMRIVYAVVKDKDENVLYNGARATTGPLVITKKSALLSLAEYKSAVLVGNGDAISNKKQGVCECEGYNLYYGKKVSCAFRKKVMKISKELWPSNYKEMANGLMAVMHRETNGTLAANQLEGYKSLIPREKMNKDIFSKINPNTGKQSSRAVGLIQFTQDSLVQMNEFENGSGFNLLHALKLSYAMMTEVEQLEKVKKYMQSVKSLPKVAEDIYIAVFAPDFVGQRNATMYKKGTDGYVSNSSLDIDDDGIQIKELLGEFKKSLSGGIAFSNYKCENTNNEEIVPAIGQSEYYIYKTGKIKLIKGTIKKSAYYVEKTVGKFKLLYILEENSYGLVEIPSSGNGFNRYAKYPDVGGISKGETVGKGDHYLLPNTAAALLGIINEINEKGWEIHLGDMSSENGSDPWGPGSKHHAGHGHLGTRKGLDIDFRYLNKSGKSYQGNNTSSEFDKEKNKTVFNLAHNYGFRSNYCTDPNSVFGENILGVKNISSHKDHGHFGLTNLDIEEVKSVNVTKI